MKSFKSTIKTLANSLGYEIYKKENFDPQSIHFLHIGKAAGTAISDICAQVNGMKRRPVLVKHHHDVFLKDLPRDCRFFFSIRDPVSRFKSGFYSKKRKGQPRINAEWSEFEDVAFGHYAHANDLAEDLFEPGARGSRAWQAMKSIRHAAQNQSDWFYCCGSFLEARPPVWIVRQENFEEDLGRFFHEADLGVTLKDIRIPSKPVENHANDYSGLPDLSEEAREKLRAWYRQDVEFCKICEEWLENRK
jgi:hypothetical protein